MNESKLQQGKKGKSRKSCGKIPGSQATPLLEILRVLDARSPKLWGCGQQKQKPQQKFCSRSLLSDVDAIEGVSACWGRVPAAIRARWRAQNEGRGMKEEGNKMGKKTPKVNNRTPFNLSPQLSPCSRVPPTLQQEVLTCPCAPVLTQPLQRSWVKEGFNGVKVVEAETKAEDESGKLAREGVEVFGEGRTG
jgi:hypothetical protein